MAASMRSVSVGSGARVTQRPQPARALLPALPRQISPAASSPLRVNTVQRQNEARQHIATHAQSKDFDSILSDIADKFEKSDKKGAVIGWSAAAVFAFFFSEWLIHLPLLNVLLGFPIQLVGLLFLPYAVVKYALDNDDYIADIQGASDRVVKRLPGFDK